MGVRLQRQLTSREALTPGQFFSAYLEQMAGVGCVVYVCCPICGAVTPLSPTHIIEPKSGKVLPAWACAGPDGDRSCSFHDWLVLDSFGVPQ